MWSFMSNTLDYKDHSNFVKRVLYTSTIPDELSNSSYKVWSKRTPSQKYFISWSLDRSHLHYSLPNSTPQPLFQWEI